MGDNETPNDESCLTHGFLSGGDSLIECPSQASTSSGLGDIGIEADTSGETRSRTLRFCNQLKLVRLLSSIGCPIPLSWVPLVKGIVLDWVRVILLALLLVLQSSINALTFGLRAACTDKILALKVQLLVTINCSCSHLLQIDQSKDIISLGRFAFERSSWRCTMVYKELICPAGLLYSMQSVQSTHTAG